MKYIPIFLAALVLLAACTAPSEDREQIQVEEPTQDEARPIVVEYYGAFTPVDLAEQTLVITPNRIDYQIRAGNGSITYETSRTITASEYLEAADLLDRNSFTTWTPDANPNTPVADVGYINISFSNYEVRRENYAEGYDAGEREVIEYFGQLSNELFTEYMNQR